MKNFKKGLKAEERSCFFLQKSGYEILGQRIKSKFGEIDILAKKGQDLFIFEVKNRKNYEEAASALNEKQIERILKTFYIYAQKHELIYENLFMKAILVFVNEIKVMDICFDEMNLEVQI